MIVFCNSCEILVAINILIFLFHSLTVDFFLSSFFFRLIHVGRLFLSELLAGSRFNELHFPQPLNWQNWHFKWNVHLSSGPFGACYAINLINKGILEILLLASSGQTYFIDNVDKSFFSLARISSNPIVSAARSLARSPFLRQLHECKHGICFFSYTKL